MIEMLDCLAMETLSLILPKKMFEGNILNKKYRWEKLIEE
jgi:hypothetical protein